ncbi:Phosphatidylserine decarboxylase [Gracilaria domingensis]|nr:Phosphatidylserine decarboxylase [Gracilaria domingensis]
MQSEMRLRKKTAFHMYGKTLGRLLLLGTGIGFGALAAAHSKEGPRVSKDAKALRAVPLNAIGIAAHYAASVPIPRPLRDVTYSRYCSVVGCNVSEADRSLEEFRSLAEFFARGIRKELRPIDRVGDLIVPCDGHVVAAGPVGAYGAIDVKGVKYRIRDLMGASEREPLAVTSVDVADRKESGSRLWYVLIHIGPEHCHRFVSPAKWIVKNRRNIEGYLLWMNPEIEDLYTQNERVAITGRWAHGFFAMTAVGAAGRGSIALDVDGESFKPRLLPSIGQVAIQAFEEDKSLERGDPLGHFRLGSALVLLFEAPEDGLRFAVKSGDSVKLGQSLITVEGSPSHDLKPESRGSKTEKGSPSRVKFRRAW